MKVLNMLADGKISAEDAAQLLDKLGSDIVPAAGEILRQEGNCSPEAQPSMIYIKVTSTERDNVDIKIPIKLLYSGINIMSLLPEQAIDSINGAASKQGMSFDFKNMRKEDIDSFIAGLSSIEINVSSREGDSVQIYCA